MSLSGIESLFIPTGKILLLGTFGAALTFAIRGNFDLGNCFERLALAMVLFATFPMFASGLRDLSAAAVRSIDRSGDQQSLKSVVLEGFDRIEDEVDRSAQQNQSKMLSSVLNPVQAIDHYVLQVWRTGVWGIVVAILEALFLVVSFLLTSIQRVLTDLVWIFFPLALGLYPVMTKPTHQLMSLSVELALWLPILSVFEKVAAKLAKSELHDSSAVGLTLLAVELTTIILTLMIPSFTHQLLSGSLVSDSGVMGKAIGSVFKGKAVVANMVRAKRMRAAAAQRGQRA